MGRPKQVPLERFLSKIIIDNDGHWMWTAGKEGNGYAHWKLEGKMIKVHRWAYEYFIDDIGEGLVYRHAKRCPKLCVNPFHARPPGTISQNVKDRWEDSRS